MSTYVKQLNKLRKNENRRGMGDEVDDYSDGSHQRKKNVREFFLCT